MFSIFPGDSVDIKPLLPDKRPTQNSLMQTEYLENEAVSTQIPHRSDKRIQVNLAEKENICTVEFDSDALVGFLNRVSPKICEYLTSNIETNIFQNYELLEDPNMAPTELCYSLLSKGQDSEFLCSAVSWNSSGTSIAATFSARAHEEWCKHDTKIAVWCVERKEISLQKPNTAIESDICVSSIAFHPLYPSVVAGGKYDGHIFVWDIGKEDDIVMATTLSSVTHREPVTGLFWGTEHKNKLISCGLDGKILIWKFNREQGKLQLKDGYIVLAEEVSRGLGLNNLRFDAEVGVVCMSINHEDPSIFVIGVEGGGIFGCSFNSVNIMPVQEDFPVTLKSPITVTFDKHNGQVTSVQFSPFLRNIFLSSSIDGEMRIYNVLDRKPVMTIHCAVGIGSACWSFVRPMVIAVILLDGHMQLYDFVEDKVNPSEKFLTNDESKSGTNIAFCNTNLHILCTSLDDGTVQVWKLSTVYTTDKASELQQFKDMTAIIE